MMDLFRRRLSITDVLVKPAGPDCNLNCTYCFYLPKNKQFPVKPRMSDEVLEMLILQLMGQPVEQISIGWQGGEPTIMGLPFYQQAINLMRRYGNGKIVANGLQTNGTLIDQEWAKFLRQNNFLVGLSLDGSKHIHDHYRANHNGKGSFDKAVNAAKLLQDHGVEVNALTVINDYSVMFPEEIYTFLKTQGLTYMQFIPCLERNLQNPSKMADFSVTADAFGNFLIKIFDFWLADFIGGAPTTSIRFFEALLLKYAGFAATECTLAKKCGNYVVIEHNGDVFSCDFFVEQDWKLGNLMENPLPELFNNGIQKRFGNQKADLPDNCRRCSWLNLCRGGCIKDRFSLDQGRERNILCDGYRQFFKHADPYFRQLAEKWKRQQGLII